MNKTHPQIESIWIEAEHWDYDNCNTDVIVEFENKRRFIASFFTLENVKKLMSIFALVGV